MVAFERGDLVFILNFHPTQSFSDYPVDVSPGEYRMVLNTDAPEFGGHDIVQGEQKFLSFTFNDGKNDRNQISIYIPARTGFILERTRA